MREPDRQARSAASVGPTEDSNVRSEERPESAGAPAAGIHLLIERLGNPDISDEEFNEILAGLALCPYCWQKVPGRWSGTLPTFSTHNNKNGSPCFGSGRVVK